MRKSASNPRFVGYSSCLTGAFAALFLLVASHLGTTTGTAAEPPAPARGAVPEKLVVLTFDDSSKSHFTVVRPLLKQYGFTATFFITEGWDFRDNKRDYMTWDEIAQLHRDGFEIGNHTRDHMAVNAGNLNRIAEQLEAIAQRCRDHQIPPPVSFAYPGNAIDRGALAVLAQSGIKFARRGGSPEYAYEAGRGIAYEPELDHPLLIPTTGDARPGWMLEDLQRAVEQARFGRIAVLQFHGVPDTAHDWVSTSPERFATFLNFLKVGGYRVIAMRDLAKYVDPDVVPSDPWGPIEDRKRRIAAQLPLDDFRPPKDDTEWRRWLPIFAKHGYSDGEIGAATGASATQLAAVRERLGELPPLAPTPGRVQILPYPGGRHPRIAFREGAIRPQRESKVSVFAPWSDGGYVVADVPEAIWVKQGDSRKLLFLAHTHIPTLWDERKQQVEAREWEQLPDGTLRVVRPLPNGAELSARATPEPRGVQFELQLTNGSNETLSGLVVQNCVMLKEARGFEVRESESKIVRSPLVAAKSRDGDRWIITGWQRCVRPWANAPCPCIHSDPQFADCAPGQTQRLQGGVWFYEGREIDAELERIQKLLTQQP